MANDMRNPIHYLLECSCGLQYVGRIIQNLCCRINKHRNYIQKGHHLHSVSRHCFEFHRDESSPITITPIDHVPISVHNRFETLKKREMYWMFRLNTLKPKGLNESKELIM